MNKQVVLPGLRWDTATAVYPMNDATAPCPQGLLVPDATQLMPAFFKQVVATPSTLAGLSAIILSLVLPEDKGDPVGEPVAGE